jgi:mevalonate kinase
MSENHSIWQASAPGSLMLMGEHAVLHGHRALVGAVDHRIHVTLEPRPDQRIRILSDLGEDETTLAELTICEPFRFIRAALQRMRPTLPGGCTLHIRSEFPPTIGFGSSAAVTVATLAAIDAWQGAAPEAADLHARACEVIRTVQGRGSGADAAASVMGGLVEYRVSPFRMEQLAAQPPLVVIYAGYKTPTPEVIAQVEARRLQRPTLFAGFFYEMDECVRSAVDAICRDQWAEVGTLMNVHQGLLEAIGVCDTTLQEIVETLRAQPGILGAKISGSGLGDCVVGLGTLEHWPLDYAWLPCAITREGVHVEKV